MPERSSQAERLFGDAVGVVSNTATPNSNMATPNPPNPSPARTPAERLFGDAVGVRQADDVEGDEAQAATRSAAAGDGEAIVETTEQRHARVLFGSPDLAAQALDLDDPLEKLADMGATIEQREQERRVFADLANRLGFERHEANKWFGLVVEQVRKGNHATEVTEENADGFDERTAEWSLVSRRRLREVYGDAEAEQIQRDYKTFIDKTPGLRERLLGGLGAHPDVLLPLVRAMRRGRRAG